MRFDEVTVLERLKQAGFDVEYKDFGDYFLLKYYEGAFLSSDNDLRFHIKPIMQALKQFNKLPNPASSRPYHELLFEILFSSYPEHMDKLQRIKEEISGSRNKKLKVVFSHCDLHSENILFQESGLRFIDFEYTASYFNFYDIACFLVEFTGIECELQNCATREEKQEALQEYFGEADQDDLRLLDLFEIVCFGVWAEWGRQMGFHSYHAHRAQKFVELISLFE